MKKYKFLAVAFVICMAMFLTLPSVVNASVVSTDLRDENLNEVEPPYYIESMLGEKIYLEDEEGNVEADKTAEYGLKYDKATNTLTLENYDGFAFRCSMKNDFKIKVVGENIIHPVLEEDSWGDINTTSGIETFGRLEFIGDGTLIYDAENVRGIDAVENKEAIWFNAPIVAKNSRRLIFNGPDFTEKYAKVGFRSITGPQARTVEIKKGKITLDSWWNDVGEIVISGGEVVVDGILESDYNFIMTGGKVTVKNGGMCSYYDLIKITGGTVEVEKSLSELQLGENMAIVSPANIIIEEDTFYKGEPCIRLLDKTTGEYAKNIKIVEYNFKEESEKQELNIKDKGSITFTIDADYEAFKNGGKVFVDGKELSSDKYTAKSGSTIITLDEEYAKSLEKGEHTLTVEFTNNAKVTTTFTVVEKEVAVEPEEEVKPEVKPEIKPEEVKPEEKPEVNEGEEGKAEVKPEEEKTETKPEIKDEVTDNKTEVKDETPNTGRQEVNVQAIVAVVMLGVVGAVVVSKKRA